MKCIWDIFKTSHKRHLFWDVFETSQRRHIKDTFLEMYWRGILNASKKTSFLRYIWDVSKMSYERRLFWDIFEMSQRRLKKGVFFEMSLRCLWDVSLNGDLIEISQRRVMPLGNYFNFPCVFSSIYEFKSTSFFILAIYNPGDSYKLLQRQKIQARGNKFMARTKTNKNIGVKIKTKRRKGLYVMTIQLLSLSGRLSYRISCNNRPFGIKRPSNKE